jgi:hypothetical protein
VSDLAKGEDIRSGIVLIVHVFFEVSDLLATFVMLSAESFYCLFITHVHIAITLVRASFLVLFLL